MEKTNFVLFHFAVKKITEPIVSKSIRKKITRGNCVKFLGVLLDETLGWKFHLIELYTKWSRSVCIFYKLRHFVPKEMLKTDVILFLSFSVL